MPINLIKRVTPILIVMLTGCATNQRFDCKLTDGVKCQNLSEIDRRVTSGEIGQASKITDKKSKKSHSLYLSTEQERYKTTKNLRTREEIAQIWVAAYETKEGIYHQPKTLHTVLKPASWANTSPETQQKQD